MTQTLQQGGQQPQTQLTSQNATALKRMQEETTQQIMDRVTGWQETGEVVLPKGYHVGNAIKLAWLYLQTVENLQHQKAIDYCTKDSICNALLNMVINGEYPQKHCYFIMYGNRSNGRSDTWVSSCEQSETPKSRRSTPGHLRRRRVRLHHRR